MSLAALRCYHMGKSCTKLTLSGATMEDIDTAETNTLLGLFETNMETIS